MEAQDLDTLMAELSEALDSDYTWPDDADDWREIGGGEGAPFAFERVREIAERARYLWLKDPLIRRGTSLSSTSVFGRGFVVDESTDRIDEALNKPFWRNPERRKELDTELRITGELYIKIERFEGERYRWMSVPLQELSEFVLDPEDGSQIMYVRRQWTAEGEQRQAWYPIWYEDRPETMAEVLIGKNGEPLPVNSDAYLIHGKIGTFYSLAIWIERILHNAQVERRIQRFFWAALRR